MLKNEKKRVGKILSISFTIIFCVTIISLPQFSFAAVTAYLRIPSGTPIYTNGNTENTSFEFRYHDDAIGCSGTAVADQIGLYDDVNGVPVTDFEENVDAGFVAHDADVSYGLGVGDTDPANYSVFVAYFDHTPVQSADLGNACEVHEIESFVQTAQSAPVTSLYDPSIGSAASSTVNSLRDNVASIAVNNALPIAGVGAGITGLGLVVALIKRFVK